MDLYTPVLALVLVAAAFAVFSVAITGIVGPKRYNKVKVDSYECGIQPTPQAVGGGRFPIKYYIIAMLFIVFDIELAFLYPLAVVLRDEGIVALVLLLVFAATVVEALIYIWRKGALEWR